MKRLMPVVVLLTAALILGCENGPTGVTEDTSAMFKKGGGGKPPGGGGGGSTANPEIAFHQNGAMLVMNRDGLARTEILRNDCSHSESSWAPTGDASAADPYRIINFAVCLPMRVASFDTVGGTVNIQSSTEIDVVGSSDTNRFGSPSWAPGAGLEIALGRDRLNAVTNEWEHAIYVIATADLPNPSPELVYEPPLVCAVDSPTWNRDGSGIAFREVCPEGQRILRADRASGSITVVIPFGIFDEISTFDWARTADVLAVTSSVPTRRGSTSAIFLVDLATGTPQLLVNGFGPTWSPDDTQIAFHTGSKRKVRTINILSGDISALGSGELPAWRR